MGEGLLGKVEYQAQDLFYMAGKKKFPVWINKKEARPDPENSPTLAKKMN